VVYIILVVFAMLVVLLLIPVIRKWITGAAEWLAIKFKVVDEWKDFLKAIKEIVTWRVMALTLGITFIGLGMQIVMLDLSVRGFGLSVPYAALFLAYILPTIAGRNSALPAGVGVTEAGMIGLLASTARIDPDIAAAAAAIFRIGTVFFQALLGALVYFLIWQREVKEYTAKSQARLSEDGD
jgi:uncharacterized protein (TIRG00374 family)